MPSSQTLEEKSSENPDIPAVVEKAPEKADLASIENEKAFDEWGEIKDSLNPEELETFIKNYPESNYAANAKIRLKAIERVKERKVQEKDSLENILVMSS